MFTLPKSEMDAMTDHAICALCAAGVFNGTALTEDEIRAAVQQKLGAALSFFTAGPFAIADDK